MNVIYFLKVSVLEQGAKKRKKKNPHQRGIVQGDLNSLRRKKNIAVTPFNSFSNLQSYLTHLVTFKIRGMMYV